MLKELHSNNSEGRIPFINKRLILYMSLQPDKKATKKKKNSH